MKVHPLALTAALLTTNTACAQDSRVTFESGKMIEVAFLKIRPGQEARLKNEYFPKAIGVAKEYGIKPLITFPAHKVSHGPADQIGMWGFFQWPSVERKNEFEQDPRFVKLRAFRDSLLVSPPKQIYLSVEKTATVELKKEKLYEAAVLWVNKGAQPHLKQYFDAAGPFVSQRQVKFIGNFKVIGQPVDPKYSFDSAPSSFIFVEWPDESVKNAWFTSKEFQRAGFHRALALDRLVVVESKFQSTL